MDHLTEVSSRYVFSKVGDTLGDEIQSTRFVTDMICSNISAFIGPESTCWVEATIAEAKDIPMISYVSLKFTFQKTMGVKS